MSGPHFDVVGVGNAVLDILAGVDDSFLEEKGFPKGSMTLVDSGAAEDLYQSVIINKEGPGGSVANSMCCLSLLGGKATFIGKVGDDNLGQIFVDNIKSIGVTFNTLPAQSGVGTGRCLVLVTGDAERTMQTYLGACIELDSDDIRADVISTGKVVFLEGYLWDPPRARDALVKAATLARKSERQVAFSLSDSLLVDRHRKEMSEFVNNYIDILFANEKEILALYQLDVLDDVIKLISSSGMLGVITRGAKGSVLIKGNTVNMVEAHSATVVDTTGAGDAYAGGFLYSYLRGNTLGECGVAGTIAASDVIGQLGTHPTGEIKQKFKKLGSSG